MVLAYLRLTRDATRRGIHGRILPVGDSCCSDKEKDGTAREIAPLLPMDLIKSWIERCTDNHGRKCHPASDTTISGFMLLDIQENKVVKGETVGEIEGYFALSYVWGNLGQPQLLLENLETLSQVGGLASINLPKTIKDACTLVSALGKRYLWVDCLCIIQDSSEHRENQIASMYQIYREATCTIVAACGGDCHHGLAGISIPRQTRYSVQLGSLKLSSVEITHEFLRPRVDHRWHVLSLATSVWNTRGWTFQEDICSSRIIFITGTMALFACQKARWREDMHLETRDSLSFDPVKGSGGMFPGNTGTLWGFTKFVEQYLRRTLSKPDDILNAFRGFEVWASDWLGLVCWGLPSEYLAFALLWRMNRSRRQSWQRREQIPSWSWVGWTMDVGGRFERDKSKLPVCDGTLRRRTKQQEMIMHFVLAEDLQKGYIFRHPGQLSICTIAKHPHFRFDYDVVKRYSASTIQRYQHPTQLIVFFTSAALVQLTLEEDGVILRSLANGKVIYQLSNTKEPDDTGMSMNSLDVLHSFPGMATLDNGAIMGIFLWEVIVLGYGV